MQSHDERSSYQAAMTAGAVVCFVAALALAACAIFAALGIYIVIAAGLVLSILPPLVEGQSARLLGGRGHVFAALAPLSFAPLVSHLATVAGHESLIHLQSNDQNGALLLAMAFGNCSSVPWWWASGGSSSALSRGRESIVPS